MLNFTNSLWGKYINESWLSHKERLDTSFQLNEKFKSYKIRTTSPILVKFENQTKYINSIYNYEELFGLKLEYRGTWSETALLFEKLKTL